MVTFVPLSPSPRTFGPLSKRRMPRSASIPARLYRRRAPPPPDSRLYHKDYTPPPASTAASCIDHLTLESADGISFYVPNYLVARSSFISDLYSLPSAKEVVPLQGVSGAALHFALGCAGDSRRVRRHSAPVHIPKRQSHSASGTILNHGFACANLPPLLPSNAWSWGFLTQVLTLAFAYDLTHALERLAADSGDFYDPVLGYTLWSLVAAAKGETDGTKPNKKSTGTSFPSAPASTSTIMSWAHALLRHDGTIPTWCSHALYTHLPDALDALQDLFARRTEVTREMAAAEERIAAGASARQKEASRDEGLNRRNTWDMFVRRTSVATFLLRVDRTDLNASITPATAAPIVRRKSLGRSSKNKHKQVPKCTSACRPTLRRKLTAATALATRQSSAEKFGTVEYFVEYTYEGLACGTCREKAKDGLVWIWCMKVPWRGGVGL